MSTTRQQDSRPGDIFKIVLLAFVAYVLFKTILKLHGLDFPLYIGYLIFFGGFFVLINKFLSDRYTDLINTMLREDEKSVNKLTFYCSFAFFWVFFFLSLMIKMFHVVIIQESRSFETIIFNGNFRAVLNFAFLLTIVYAFYIYTRLNAMAKNQQIVQQKVITGAVSAQFESLKNQLDPHFLFNSLNVLGALIEEDQEKAVAFNQSLSRTYRYILDQKNKELVPLEEELAFAKMYIELLQMRFEDSLTFEFPEAIKQEGAKVVPLSLQLLLENVIKHNKATSSKPVHIVIKEEAEGYLTVRNNLNKKTIIDTRKGIGLENIATRYSLLTSKPIKVEETEDFFSVKIPILTKKLEHMKIIDVQESDQELLIEAKKKIEEYKKFYAHLTSFILVSAFLIMINLMTYDGFMWSFIPLFAWGIAVGSHAMKVYNYNLFLGKDWEDKKVREYMNERKNDNANWQ
ncbi:2TM domain-containing protein [Myroides pelagicus]|uniref:Histidine kinase n=1 Tax=Myroides pelagicus TaxID=270914 RepID=A0A7K1GMV5_9FLAO|nr:2TM domain-containing protein [Myroides pelagicus]MEC4114884.1 2TM domain-containing protein [Myroides pelagicus]MTH30242.1 histidine kinase [Myroides pelagicus]